MSKLGRQTPGTPRRVDAWPRSLLWLPPQACASVGRLWLRGALAQRPRKRPSRTVSHAAVHHPTRRVQHKSATDGLVLTVVPPPTSTLPTRRAGTCVSVDGCRGGGGGPVSSPGREQQRQTTPDARRQTPWPRSFCLRPSSTRPRRAGSRRGCAHRRRRSKCSATHHAPRGRADLRAAMRSSGATSM